MSSIRDSWRTPPWLWSFIKEIWNPALDVCASDTNRLCDTYFTEEVSCLDNDWHSSTGVAYCNPPYSDPLPFIMKAIEQRNNVTTVFLLNLDPSTRWFCEALPCCEEVVILTGSRVKFVPPEGVESSSNSKPQVVLVIGKNPEVRTSYLNIRQLMERD